MTPLRAALVLAALAALLLYLTLLAWSVRDQWPALLAAWGLCLAAGWWIVKGRR